MAPPTGSGERRKSKYPVQQAEPRRSTCPSRQNAFTKHIYTRPNILRQGGGAAANSKHTNCESDK